MVQALAQRGERPASVGFRRGRDRGRKPEALGNGGPDRAGMLAQPLPVVAPRLGALHRPEGRNVLVEVADLDPAESRRVIGCREPSHERIEDLAGRRVGGIHDLIGHEEAPRQVIPGLAVDTLGGIRPVVAQAPLRHTLQSRAVAGQPPDGVEALREGQNALPRHETVGRAEPPEALVRGGHPNRSGGVGGKSDIRLTQRDGARRSAG